MSRPDTNDGVLMGESEDSGRRGGAGSATEEGADRRRELERRCDRIEESYEFMLAYAAQGLAGEEGSGAAGEIREYLNRCDAALTGLAELVSGLVADLGAASAEPHRAFVGILERDAWDARALVRLVLAQPSISSQLVDNLNASIHLRALLMDLFLVDEVLKIHSRR
jgi:hypothetical protein